MPSPVFLSVSLVLYHSPLGVLEETLQSLAGAVREAHVEGLLSGAELLLVDHTPDAGYRSRALALAKSAGSDCLAVRELEVCGNAGFGAGHNRALASARGDIHLVLNPDLVLQSDALARGLAALAADPGTVLVAPRVSGADGAPEHLCKRYPSVLLLLIRALGWRWLQRLCDRRLAAYEMRELATSREPVVVPLVSGCFMLVRSADLRELGGFDEAYFLYFEDFDLCLRLAARGRLVYQPGVRVVHHGGYAARKGWRHIWLFARAGRRFFARYGWRWL